MRRDHSDLSSGDKIAITIVIAIALLILLALFGFLTGRWDKADAQDFDISKLPPKGTFVGKSTPYDAHMIELDKEALDEAYKSQLAHLFSIWMKSDEQQPERAINGARQARRAYILVRMAIEQREKPPSR